jgi:hypothetical protein
MHGHAQLHAHAHMHVLALTLDPIQAGTTKMDMVGRVVVNDLVVMDEAGAELT